MENKVTIRYPLTREEHDDIFVGVNGKTYLIQRGVDVEVPRCVARVLSRKEAMLGIALNFEQQAARPLDALEG